MKILVIGDLHGQMPKIHFKEFDVIIAPGDFCSDKDIRKYSLKSYKEFLSNPSKYRNWWDIVGRTKAKKIMTDSLSSGRKILKKLDTLGVPVYIIPGNWDFAGKDKDWKFSNKNYYREYLTKNLKNVKSIHSKIAKFEDIILIGYGLANGPELLKYRDYEKIPKSRYKKNILKYKKLTKRYDKLFLRAKDKPVIFLSHNVPFNTKLDRIVNKDSPRNGYHYGSNLARKMILRHKPLLCIGGHMHEHYGTCKLGMTLVLNAGFGGEKNTLIELKDGKIKSIKFHGKKK